MKCKDCHSCRFTFTWICNFKVSEEFKIEVENIRTKSFVWASHLCVVFGYNIEREYNRNPKLWESIKEVNLLFLMEKKDTENHEIALAWYDKNYPQKKRPPICIYFYTNNNLTEKYD